MIPTNPTLVDIARVISEAQLKESIQFYVILVVLGVIAALVFWFVSPYLGERGKLLAAAETLNARLDEIRHSTEAVEKVRTRIAHGDWTVKEYKTLLRTKLEQLMGAAYRMKSASETDSDFKDEVGDLHMNSKEPMLEVELLSTMYFGVLNAEVAQLKTAYVNFVVWLIGARSKVQKQILQVNYDHDVLERLRESPGQVVGQLSYAAQFQTYKKAKEDLIELRKAYVDEYRPLAVELEKALRRLETRATILMTEYIAPTVI